MKVLIWFLCILANTLVITLIKESGVILGAIPTAILYGVTFWLARTLCKKWDEHKENKAVDQNVPAYTDTTDRLPYTICYLKEEPENEINNETSETDKICFCRKCGHKLIDGASFCNKCGTQVVKEQGENDL